MFVQHFVWTDNKKTSKACVTLPVWGEATGGRRLPKKVTVTRKMFPFDDVITCLCYDRHVDKGTILQHNFFLQLYRYGLQFVLHRGIKFNFCKCQKTSLLCRGEMKRRTPNIIIVSYLYKVTAIYDLFHYLESMADIHNWFSKPI